MSKMSIIQKLKDGGNILHIPIRRKQMRNRNALLCLKCKPYVLLKEHLEVKNLSNALLDEASGSPSPVNGNRRHCSEIACKTLLVVYLLYNNNI